MKCIKCAGETRVTNTQKESSSQIKRARKCKVCGSNFYTRETVIEIKGRGFMTGLERLRENNKLARNSLAVYLNISHSTYTAKERGETEFTFSEAYKVAKYFYISMEELYTLLTTIVEE